MKTVAVVVGSNRKESVNMKFARAIEKLAEGKLKFDYVDVPAIPMFNDDDVPNAPASVQALRDKVTSADALLLVTPEYNRSITAPMKSVIDWGTRPYGQNIWNGRPTAIIGTSPGIIGTATAQMHLRTIMVSMGSILMGRPEVYLHLKPGLIDDDYSVTDEGTAQFLGGFVDSLVSWVGTVGPK